MKYITQRYFFVNVFIKFVLELMLLNFLHLLKYTLFNKTTTSNEKEGIHLNRRVITFLICVLMAIFFWLMMSLSKEYNISINFPVKYINLPEDKVLANQLPQFIDIDIKANGFNLLVYKLKRRYETILIDIKDSKPLPLQNHYYLHTSFRIDKITSQFRNKIEILKINPDTLFFNFNKKITKTVPVRPNLHIAFGNHYQQADSIQLTPSYIAISGAVDVIDKINYVETVPMNLKNVTKSISFDLSILKTTDLKFVDLSRPFVHVIINVKKYTEASIELPIKVKNLPANYSLKIFPDKVSVKYNVAFDDYEKINTLQFSAIVDYFKIEQGNNKLKVQLIKYPSGIRSIKLNTEKVEYIIRK